MVFVGIVSEGSMRDPTGYWKCSKSGSGWWFHRCTHRLKYIKPYI